MNVTDTTPPSVTVAFSDLPGNTAFIRGGGNVAYLKTADGQALRLGDAVLDGTVLPTDQVQEAPNATVSMFPTS